MLPPIGKYKVTKLLGEGGFGKVYLAFDPDVGQPVAIKKLRVGGDSDLLRRFQLEIRTTASLRHKNIVTIHASGEDAGEPYLVMEFLEGSTLKQVIQDRRPLTLLEKVRIMTQVAEGLAYANSKGIVHRDVKPENIMLMPDDNVKIMDFGIALGPNRNTNVTQTGGIIGTPPYFAPEQLEGLKASEQTDIFSFGDVYYELLTGNHPFAQFKNDWKSLQFAILSHEPESISGLVPGCPEALELLVHRTLAKAPEFRYQSFEELLLDSEAILVDLRHEGAAAILREVRPLIESGNLQTAQMMIRQAYQLEPGNREVRRLHEDIKLQIQKRQIQDRVEELLAEAAKQMAERRFAEAVQNLESCLKLDSTNPLLLSRLDEARARLDSHNRVNRLVSEGRFKQQKGLLDDARGLFQAALAIDPEHTDARRLSQRVMDELKRRQLEQELQQAIRSAREHLAAKQFAEALAILDQIDQRQPGVESVAKLRAEIQNEEAEEVRRLRAERFNLALARTVEAIQSGDLELAGPMLDHLFANFAGEPGAAEMLPGLRQRLDVLIRGREVAQYQDKARGLLRDKSFPEALALLNEAVDRFPDEPGLTRLNQLAQDLYQAHQRSQAIAAALAEAAAKRATGDLQGALDTLIEARQRLGEEAAFTDLSGQLEREIEQQRYKAALEKLVLQGRQLVEARRYSEAVDRIQRASEFAGEPEVRALLETARAGAAVELEQRLVADTLAAVENLESQGAWNQALDTVRRVLSKYPQNPKLIQTADRLRDRIEEERRKARVDRHRNLIRQEIEKGNWQRAESAVLAARADLPADGAFDDLAAQVEAGKFDAGLRDLEARVRQNLAANAITQAEQNLDATRSIYARDPRWTALVQEVAKRRQYETVLFEAGRQLDASRFSEAETLLLELIQQGPPDRRAEQLRDAIRVQRSEASRQAEIARIAQGIRELLKADDLAQAVPNLTAARARFPGEGVWAELQDQIDARQQALRRQAEIAGFEEKIGQAVKRDDIRGAMSALNAARAKYPQEPLWAELERRVKARQEFLGRQAEVAAVGQNVRRLLKGRRDNMQAAVAELKGGVATYPGEALWDTLQSEIAARRAFFDSEDAIAKRVRESVERSEFAEAEAQVRAAQVTYPDPTFWETLLVEIGVGRSIQSVRDRLKQDDLSGATKDLAAARASYPNNGVWQGLQQEIDARQAAVERDTYIKEVAEGVRRSLSESGASPIVRAWDALRAARAGLDQGQAKYPGQVVWGALQDEIARHQAQVESEVTGRVRACSNLVSVDSISTEFATAQTRYPDDPFWAVLRVEIDRRREPLEQASVSEFEARVRDCIQIDDVRGALVQLGAGQRQHPKTPLWAKLQAEITARQAALEREEELAAVERSVREQLASVTRIPAIESQADAFHKATALLVGPLARYPKEARLATLRNEIDSGRRRWQEDLSEQIGGAIREKPSSEVLQRFATPISSLRSKEPKEALWVALEGELTALAARLQLQEAVANVERGVREQLASVTRIPAIDLQAEAFQKAGGLLAGPLARYPKEARLATLRNEIDSGRRRWQEDLAGQIRSAIREKPSAEVLQRFSTPISSLRSKEPKEALWAALESELTALAALLNQQETVTTVERGVREQLESVTRIPAIDLQAEAFQKAGALLAVPLAKYPQETRLATLRNEIEGGRKQWQDDLSGQIRSAIREKPSAEILQRFATPISSLRSKEPKEALWAALESELTALAALLNQQETVATAERGIRQQLESVARIPEIDLQAEAFQKAAALLAGPLAKYPQEVRLATLWNEIDSRRKLWEEDLSAQIRGAIREKPSADILQRFATPISSLRSKEPKEALWAALETELTALAALLKQQEVVATVERSVREQLGSAARITSVEQQCEAFQKAFALLTEPRANYPDEARLATLQTEIDRKRKQWQSELAAQITKAIQTKRTNDTVQRYALTIHRLRTKEPQEAVWIQLEAEINALESWLKQQEAVAAVERGVQEHLASVAKIPTIELQCEVFQKADALLTGPRAKYPDEARLRALQTEIEGRRKRWQNEVSGQFSQAIKTLPPKDALQRFSAPIRRLRTIEPEEPLWVRLTAEVDALEALLNRQADIAATADRLRTCLRRDDFRQAVLELNAGRAKHPNDELWTKLENEIEQARAQRQRDIEDVQRRAELLLTQGRPQEVLTLIEERFGNEPALQGLLAKTHQAIEQQRRWEARNRDRDRLLTIREQLATESRKRKRAELDREAQRVAAGHVNDQEILALTAQIREQIEATPAASSRMPYIAAAAGVVVVIGFGALWLLPPPVSVNVLSQPAGAAITVDGRPCPSPCSLRLGPGEHTFDAQLQGYEPRRQVSQIQRSVPWTSTEVAVALKAIPPMVVKIGPDAKVSSVPQGTLQITSDPDGVTVSVDGRNNQLAAGQTRLSASLPAGSHQIRLTKPNYQTLDQRIEIQSNAVTVRTFTLQPFPALLDVTGYPAGTEISIDGTPRARVGSNGKLTRALEVAPGAHTVGLSHEGYQPTTQRVSVNPNERVNISADTLKLVAIKRDEVIPPPPPPKKDTVVKPEEVAPAKKVAVDPDAALAQEWSRLQNSDDVAALDGFRNRHPGTTWASKASDRISQLEDRARQAQQARSKAEYASLDKNDLQALRNYAATYPNSDLGKQALARAASMEQDLAAKKQVSAAINAVIRQFNTLQGGRAKELKTIWRGASDAFLKPPSHTTYELQATGEPVISGNQARVACSLTTIISQPKSSNPQSVNVQLRNEDGHWLIDKIERTR